MNEQAIKERNIREHLTNAMSISTYCVSERMKKKQGKEKR